MRRLRGGAVVPLALAGLLVIQAGLLFAFPSGRLVHALNAWMIAVLALLGLALLPRPRGSDEDGTLRAVPDGSAATLLLAVGIVALVLGASLGTWMLLIGGGLAATGLGGLAREWRASREARP